MKRLLLLAWAFLALFVICAHPVEAQAIAANAAYSAKLACPFYTLGDITFAFPNIDTSTTVIDFRQGFYNHSDMESISIDFPLFTAGVAGRAVDGITPGAGAKANIIPFGPVNLALPSISQRRDETIIASKTSFHTE